MKLKECLKLGEDLGAKTVGEAFDCVVFHRNQLFLHMKETKEINEIVDEFEELHKKGLIDNNTLIDNAFKLNLK